MNHLIPALITFFLLITEGLFLLMGVPLFWLGWILNKLSDVFLNSVKQQIAIAQKVRWKYKMKRYEKWKNSKS